MALKKPLLVLKKKREMDDDGENSSKSHCTELEVVGIIRHRILFKTRPKALISSTSFIFSMLHLQFAYSPTSVCRVS